MRLREIMRTAVVTVEASEAASNAYTRMQQRRIRHLVVRDDGRLLGVISERDLGGRGGGPLRKDRTVRELMSGRLVTATPQTTLRQAANLMRGRIVGCIPVLDGERLVGIVTATDVLDELGRGFARPAVGGRRRKQRAAPPNRRKSTANPTVYRRSRAKQPVGRARNRQPDRQTRSPFVSALPRAQKRQAGPPQSTQVPAFVRAVGADLRDTDRRYIRRKLGMKLGKFSPAIERVSVRLTDVNGPRGGIDQACQIKVVLSGLPSVVFKDQNAAAHAAIDGAIAGAERAVRRTLQRRRIKPLRRAA